eukprot:COSAG02_NODE_31492_length_532_cov_2.258661_1_plen_45_part_10
MIPGAGIAIDLFAWGHELMKISIRGRSSGFRHGFTFRIDGALQVL